MNKDYFRVEDLTVGYDKNALIRDICFSIRRGEILTLIGPNGSGKSTILKTLTRHLARLRGDVKVMDASIFGLSYADLAKTLSVLLTDRVKGEMMTCFDVAATGRYPYTGRLGILSEEDKEKVRETLTLVQADTIASREFGRVSDGQRQRILLARAFCQEPDIMVLDEPTSYLDIKYKLELLTILRRLAKEKGITVLLSLHEIDLAQKISDKVICVSGDVIRHFGTPEEIFREAIIRDLYRLEGGTYNTRFGSIELPAPAGPAQTFVISAGGRGIPVYRRLARAGIPFISGILYTNDIDFELAKSLACRVIDQEAFLPIGQEKRQEAAEAIRACRYVINAGFPDVEMLRPLSELVGQAEKAGKLVNLAGLLAIFEQPVDAFSGA